MTTFSQRVVDENGDDVELVATGGAASWLCPHCGEPYPCAWTRAAFSKTATSVEADRQHTQQPAGNGRTKETT